jgi:hypothetical protein
MQVNFSSFSVLNTNVCAEKLDRDGQQNDAENLPQDADSGRSQEPLNPVQVAEYKVNYR